MKVYEGVSKNFRTGRLEVEMQMVQLSAARCSCIAILWVSLVSFTAITLCIVSQQVFIFVSVYFDIDSVRKLLDTPLYVPKFVESEYKICYLLKLHIWCTNLTYLRSNNRKNWSKFHDAILACRKTKSASLLRYARNQGPFPIVLKLNYSEHSHFLVEC
jgi:hypothetical protein